MQNVQNTKAFATDYTADYIPNYTRITPGLHRITRITGKRGIADQTLLYYCRFAQSAGMGVPTAGLQPDYSGLHGLQERVASLAQNQDKRIASSPPAHGSVDGAKFATTSIMFVAKLFL